ncbi:DUF7282 domain-containing protein [Halosimplex sp. J119]
MTGDSTKPTTFERRGVSTYGVLFVLAIAVAAAITVPAFATASPGPADGDGPAAAIGDRSACPTVGSTAGSAGAAASSHSRESYPDAPHMDVARGDIAAIETGVGRTRTGTVRIQSVDGEFNVTLTFANNDGRKPATLYVNTYLAGNESAVAGLAYTAGDNDRVAVESRDSVTGAPMPTGAYDVTIEKRSGTETKRLTIDDPSVGDLTLLRAPGERFENLSTSEDVAEGLESGVVSTPTATDDGPAAALGDTMVYRLNASGLYGLLAAQGGATAEDNYVAVADASATPRTLSLDIRGTGPCGPVADVPGSIEDGSVQVIPDSTNETLYVTADLRRVERSGNSERRFVRPGEATYTFYGGTHVTGSNVTKQLDYGVTERQVTYDPARQPIRREAAAGQSIGGETTLAPHSELTLDVEAIGDDYETQAQATVEADGSFSTTVDLSEAPADARLTLSTAEVEETKTLLTTGDAAGTALWFQEYESPNADRETVVEGVSAALEEGGFVAAYAVPPDEQVTHENLIGRSTYLEPGVHRTNVSLDRAVTDSQIVVLAVHRDEDGDGRFDYPADDSPYRIDGRSVHTAGRVLLSGDGSEPPRDPQFLTVDLRSADNIDGTPVPTATPTDTPTVTPTDTPAPTETPRPVGTTELPPPTLRGEATPTATPDEPGTATANGTDVGTTAVNGTAAPNATTAGGDTAESTDGLGSGFGPVAVLAAAFVLALAALVRRS